MKNVPGYTADASLRIVGEQYCIETENSVLSNDQVTPQLGLPTAYGNWCGPLAGKKYNTACPTKEYCDEVDRVCMVHDNCYGSKGYFHCACDFALLRDMPGAIGRTSSAAGKAAGVGAIAVFASLPCLCYIPTPYPCGVKMCSKWGVPYPCGVKTCWKNIPVAGGGGGIGACSWQ